MYCPDCSGRGPITMVLVAHTFSWENPKTANRFLERYVCPICKALVSVDTPIHHTSGIARHNAVMGICD